MTQAAPFLAPYDARQLAIEAQRHEQHYPRPARLRAAFRPMLLASTGMKTPILNSTRSEQP